MSLEEERYRDARAHALVALEEDLGSADAWQVYLGACRGGGLAHRAEAELRGAGAVRPAPSARPPKLSRREVRELLAGLDGADAAEAYRARRLFVGAGLVGPATEAANQSIQFFASE